MLTARALPDPTMPLACEASVPTHLQVAAVAALRGDATAIMGVDRTLTYTELATEAADMAARLSDVGVAPLQVVAIDARRDVDLVVAILATWQVGAGVILLDPAHPESWREATLDAVRPAARIGREATSGLATVSALPRPRDFRDATGGDFAYVAATSGTTGAPRLILGGHRPLAHFLDWQRAEFALGPATRVAMLSGLAHDPLLRDIFAPLTAGGRLAIPPDTALRDPAQLGPWLAEHAVDHVHWTPSLAGALATGWDGTLPDLRRAFFGGERLAPECAARVRRLAPEAALFNLYGATETPQGVSCGVVPEAGPVPLGPGIPGVQVLVVDPAGTPVSVGDLGEIAVRSPYLAHGYLDDPAATATRFICNPATGRSDDRLYLTGDLGRARADGSLDFVGRADRQVKRGGVRIELAAIEARALAHPAIHAAVATSIAAHDGLIVLFVAADAAARFDLASWIAQALPSAQCPHRVCWRDDIPLTASGKTDVRMLERTFVADLAAATHGDDTLHDLACHVLGMTGISVDDDLLALGLQSLRALSLLGEIRRRFGVSVTVPELRDTPTLRGLAARIAAYAEGPVRATGHVPDTAAATPAQTAIWLAERIGGRDGALHIPVVLELRGALDDAAIARHVATIQRRHPALRTIFRDSGTGLEQIVSGQSVDLIVAPIGEPDIKAVVEATILARFDLATGPLHRPLLLRVAPDHAVLVWTFHHAIFDGTSRMLLVRELAALIGGEALVALPEGPVLSDPDVTPPASVASYVARLEHLAPLDLAPVDAGGADGARGVSLDPALTAAIHRRARDERTTPFAVLLAAYEVVLARMTDATSFAVGAPRSTRGMAQAGLLGCFVDMTIVRAEVDLRASFASHLQRTIAEHAVALEEGRVPLEDVRAAFRRACPGRPFPCEAVLVLEEARADVRAGAVHLCERDWWEDRLRYDLELHVWPAGEGFGGRLLYPASFGAEKAAWFAAAFRHALEQFCADPTLLLAECRLEAPEQQAKWRALGHSPDQPPALLPLLEAIDGHAARAPDKVAVRFGKQVLGYRDLVERSNALAQDIVARGVTPGDRVAILLPQGPDRIVVALAVLRAGAAYVPLEDDAAEARRDFVLADAAPHLVITDRPCGAVPTLPVGTARAAVSPAVAVAPQADAYVIYTSGSTGRPKGVRVGRDNLDRLFGACEDWLHAGPDDVWACCHSFAFDFSVWEMWGALRSGGCVALATRAETRDPRALRDFLLREGITVLSQTPSSFGQFVAADDGDDLPALRLVVFGGEALDPQMLAPWIARHGDARPALVNMYGITETTVHVTRRRILARDLALRGSHIGQPIADMTVRVLDGSGHLAAVGVPGEIHVGGAGVSNGYLGQPALTAARFAPDPWSETPGARLYRSGDRGMLRADGDVQYLGRLDDQVQLRGVRLELGEVEAALRMHPGVAAAAALVQEAGADDRRLVAYVVHAPGAPMPSMAELTHHLASRLPGGITAQIFRIDALPLTANGKVDRTALATRRHATSEPPRGSFGARSLVETIVVEAFRDVLGLAEVPGDADFFALGGHSLLATRLVARLRAVLGVEVPLSVLFENATITGIADAAQRALDRDGATGVEPILPYRGEAPPPASSAQQRIWFAHQQDEGGAERYNSRLNLDIAGPLDIAALKRALSAVVARHEPLRTGLALVDGKVVQHVRPAAPVALRVVDAATFPDETRAASIDRMIAQHYSARFDLERHSMVRFGVVRLAPARHLLLITFHHCAYDGRSSQIFLDEVARDYDAFSRGADHVEASAPLRYADYAVWEEARVEGAEMRTQIVARAGILRGIEPFRLPAEPDATPGDMLSGRIDRQLPAALCADAAALARTTNATPFMVLMAAVTLLLHRLSGEGDVVLGIASANRGRGEIGDLIGMFVNVLTVTAEVSPGQSFADLLITVRGAMLDALDHQDVPFERLVEAVAPERGSTDTPLVQVIAAFHPWSECADFSAGEAQFSAMPEGDSPARFDLEFHFWPGVDGALTMRTIYSRARFSERAIEQYLARFEAIAQTCFRAPEMTLDDVASLEVPPPTAEVRPTLPGGSILDMFDARVAEAPDRDAVIDGAERWSYARLHRMSSRIAARLQDAGIGRGDIVAVAGQRSAWVVAAFLGILRAGGAYLPIDPDAPAEWQERLLAHAALALVAEHVVLPGATPHIVLSDASFVEAAPNPVAIGQEDLAYVSFTSGSTGAPSGVMIPHRGIVQLLADMGYAPIRPGERVAHAAALSFDATTFELWGALAHGGTIVVVPRDTALDPARFAAVIRQGFGAMFLTTSLFNRLAEEAPDCFAAVGTLLTGGEAADGRMMARVRPDRLANVYGPTECTTFATRHPVGDAVGSTVPIGQPLPFAEAHVLDGAMRAVPPGVAGELCIGGPGLAWGYLGNPRKTAECFVPNPFAAVPGARLYRTGDRVRRDETGDIDFLGRLDRQVKIRGFRIEPAAIEAELQAHPDVSRAIVTVSDDAVTGARLSAFVVPRDAGPEAEGVESWEKVFDEQVYQLEAGTADPLFDTRGWLDSRTGHPIPEREMRIWADDIAAIALAGSPRRVLDIGCGLGIHLFRLAPHVEQYRATDVSQAALDFIAARLPLLGRAAERVSIDRCVAHRIAEVAEGPFDLIQIVSVAQYFPSVAYLRQVIEAAARLLAPGGRILIGDVRSLPLLRTFHSWVVAAQAGGGQSAAHHRAEVERRVATERELAVDPRFFEACATEIPGLSQARIALSGGSATNELTLFRYNVELCSHAAPVAEAHVVDATTLDVADVDALLARSSALVLRDVPNSLAASALAAEAEYFPEVGGPLAGGLDRAAIRRLAAQRGLRGRLSWPASGARDRIDVVFSPRDAQGALPSTCSVPVSSLANRPIDPSLPARLRDYLAARLPSYALPTSITAVNAVPLTPTGKIDRATLRAWDRRHDRTGPAAPDGPVEDVLCRFWAKTLGRNRVGPEENFFELGGHSLLAIRLVEHLRSTFGTGIPLGRIFEHPVPRSMARALVDAERVAGDTFACAEAYIALSQLSDADLEALDQPPIAVVAEGRR